MMSPGKLLVQNGDLTYNRKAKGKVGELKIIAKMKSHEGKTLEFSSFGNSRETNVYISADNNISAGNKSEQGMAELICSMRGGRRSLFN